MALTKVFEPINIAGCKVPNRVVRTAHATGLGGGVINDSLISYHEARARGGVGLSILEILSVHPTSPGSLNMIDPTLDDGYAKLMAAVRPHGMKVFQQLWHAGHNTNPLDGTPPWAPSDVPNPRGGDVPQPMTKAMIDEIVGAYAAAAARCEAAGLDGVEVHGAHGYLVQQFLSPIMNRREDEYGGSFENRARFMMEVMTAVKAATSGNFPVGIRLAPDMTHGGVDVETNIRAAQLLEDNELIDFVDVSMGNYHSFPKMIGGMHEETGYELPTSAPIAAAVSVPSIATGRFRTLEEADQVIRQGQADMVSMVRAHIADPDLVTKTRAGRVEEVRPCIACNQGCVGGLFAGQFGCVVNAAVGAEASLDESQIAVASEIRKVCVIGGGLAGMEAARIAAKRGHKVVLFEAGANLGGAVRISMKLPTRHGIGDIAVWLESEIYRLGVDVRLSSYAEAEDILTEKPDAVIVATGAMPRMDGIQSANPGEVIEGFDAPHVLSSEDLLADGRNWQGSHAVVFDDTQHYEPIGVAEHLISQGADVTYVTPAVSIGGKVEDALMPEPALERMAKGPGNLTVRTRYRLKRISTTQAIITPRFEGPEEAVQADTIVIVTPNRPNRDLFNDLQGKVQSLTLVGDANSPRYMQAAIREGHMAARAL